MATLTFSPEAKTQLPSREEELLEELFGNPRRIEHDEHYCGDMLISFTDTLTGQSYTMKANEISWRHLEEFTKNTLVATYKAEYLTAYLRQLYPDKEFTCSLYGDNEEHIICELQAERLGTSLVGIARKDGSNEALFARQLPLGFEEDLINEEVDFYGSNKSYMDYTNYMLEILCSKKNA